MKLNYPQWKKPVETNFKTIGVRVCIMSSEHPGVILLLLIFHNHTPETMHGHGHDDPVVGSNGMMHCPETTSSQPSLSDYFRLCVIVVVHNLTAFFSCHELFCSGVLVEILFVWTQ